jgi:hypothetical protein
MYVQWCGCLCLRVGVCVSVCISSAVGVGMSLFKRSYSDYTKQLCSRDVL